MDVQRTRPGRLDGASGELDSGRLRCDSQRHTKFGRAEASEETRIDGYLAIIHAWIIGLDAVGQPAWNASWLSSDGRAFERLVLDVEQSARNDLGGAFVESLSELVATRTMLVGYLVSRSHVL